MSWQAFSCKTEPCHKDKLIALSPTSLHPDISDIQHDPKGYKIKWRTQWGPLSYSKKLMSFLFINVHPYFKLVIFFQSNYIHQSKVHIIQDGLRLQTCSALISTRQRILWRWNRGNKSLLYSRLLENWKHVYGGRSAQLFRTQNIFLCWIFPAVLQENPYCGGSLHCKTCTAAM